MKNLSKVIMIDSGVPSRAMRLVADGLKRPIQEDQFMVYVNSSDISLLPGLTPKHDERFTALLEGAVSGDVPIYFAAVPLALCVPFDPDYRPDLHPVGSHAIDQVFDAWSNGQFQKLFVYQRRRSFVVSDDYIPLFAALRGQPDCVPCWVFGRPDSDLARDVQGPIAQEDVFKILGLEVQTG
jgi:hypothetical protein